MKIFNSLAKIALIPFKFLREFFKVGFANREIVVISIDSSEAERIITRLGHKTLDQFVIASTSLSRQIGDMLEKGYVIGYYDPQSEDLKVGALELSQIYPNFKSSNVPENIPGVMSDEDSNPTEEKIGEKRKSLMELIVEHTNLHHTEALQKMAQHYYWSLKMKERGADIGALDEVDEFTESPFV